MEQNVMISQATAPTIIEALSVCIAAKRPTFLWGSPGIGKSDLHRELAAQLKRPLLDLRASQWDAVDTRGVPYVYGQPDGKRRTGWAVPDIFPSEPDANTLIFLDELNSAPQSVQAALYQLILDRRLGDYVLPDGVDILAAGNKETDRAVTHRMSSALADRFFHFEMLIDNDAWERWALQNDVHIACVAYNRWRPGHLHSWDAASPSKSQATPRGWQYVSDVLKAMDKAGTNGAVESVIIAGKLGEAVGAEFCGFLKIFRDLPDPDAVIMAPDAAAISSDPAVNYALCGALTERTTPDNVERVFRYAERLGEAPEAGPEFMALLVRSVALSKPDTQQSKAFIQWCSQHSDVYL